MKKKQRRQRDVTYRRPDAMISRGKRGKIVVVKKSDQRQERPTCLGSELK